MDADYTSDLGHTLNSRQENYRLTHPDTPDSGTASNPALTGYDTGSNATLGRATLNPPDPVQWSNSGNHRTVTTAEPEPAHTNSRSTEFRSTEFGTPPAANTGTAFNSGTPTSNSGSYSTGTSVPTSNSPFGTMPANGTNDSPFGAPATSTSYGTSAPATTTGASSFGTAAPTSHGTVAPTSHAAPAAPSPATTSASTTSARAASAAPASTIEPQHVMRLLLASHDLDTAASKAESGEGSVADLTRAAHNTRAAAVELIAAWYGGTDHMRNFAEALLQAASETA